MEVESSKSFGQEDSMLSVPKMVNPSLSKISNASSTTQVLKTGDTSKSATVSSTKVGRNSSKLEKLNKSIGNIIMRAISLIKSGFKGTAIQKQTTIGADQQRIGSRTNEILEKVTTKKLSDEEMQKIGEEFIQLQKESDQLKTAAKKEKISLPELNKFHHEKKGIADERKARMEDYKRALDHADTIPTEALVKLYEKAECKDLNSREAELRKEAKKKNIDYDAININEEIKIDDESVNESLTASTDTSISDSDDSKDSDVTFK